MNKYIVLTISILFFLVGYAQEENCPEPKKKAVKYFKSAQTASFKEKKTLLIEAIKIDPNYLEAYDELANLAEKSVENAYNTGSASGVQQYTKIKLDYWKKIVEICPAYRNFYHTLELGNHYFGQRKYAEAKPYFQKIMASPNAYKKDERYANERLEDIATYFKLIKDTVPFSPIKLEGPSSKHNEYLPMLSPDNRYLYYTRNMPDEDKNAFDAGYKEVFVQSRKMGKNKFTSGMPMPSPFNLGQYQGGVSVSVDNKLMFITLVEVIPYRGENRAGLGQMFDNADIYFTEFIDGEWTKLQSIGSNINTPTTWEAQPSISSDNKTLYFTRVVDPFGGDMDIYKCERQPNGSWGDPINLGYPINTPGDEKSPFMHSDSYTLYFSSNEHIGIGGYDIFYSKMNPTTGQFNKPKNIGYPINTDKDEHGFVVSKDGDYAYYSSKGDNNQLDIYSFELYEEARPEEVLFVNGEILDNNGNVPDGAKVMLKNTKTNQEVEAVIDKQTGSYVGVVRVDKDEDIMLTAKKEGYAFSSQLISSNEIVVGKPIQTKKMEVKPIEVGSAHTINDINFATNSYEITPKIMLVLNEFVDFLKTNPTVKIAIHGHTDNVGNPQDNLELSERRAKAVYDYLLLEDIDASRLTSKGFGSSQPIASNDTELGRAKNRRTEFVIVEK